MNDQKLIKIKVFLVKTSTYRIQNKYINDVCFLEYKTKETNKKLNGG